MFHNTVLSPFSYFYAIGNTPAVSLTQDLISEQDADILLLGCGDARNVLFTCYADKKRKIDFTCCDIEAGIHARNILLYTLLVDDRDGENIARIWNIYFHWKLDSSSLDLLSQQAKSLLKLSNSAEAWQKSQYGTFIKFCDARSLEQVRAYWEGYVTATSPGESSRREKEMQANLDRARNIRIDRIGADGTSMTGLRSAAPLAIHAFRDVNEVAQQWWKQGTTTSGRGSQAKPSALNPAFLFSPNQGLTLHYGTEPLLGFPLATAYAPLKKSSPFYLAGAPAAARRPTADMFKGASSSTWLVDATREQFRLWAGAFRESVAAGVVVRVFVGDALTFCAALLQAGKGDANMYSDNWAGAALALAPNGYKAPNDTAPTRFDVIDTSNLLDHLGSLNMMVLNAGLLKTQSTSCLYTEVLVGSDAPLTERLKGLFGIEPRFLALLMDLLPVEMYTNATHNNEDDSVLNQLTKSSDKNARNDQTQLRSRLRWRSAVLADQSSGPGKLKMESKDAAKLMISLYSHMFKEEDLTSMMSALMSRKVFGMATSAYYNKASFAILLNAIHQRLTTDWDQAMDGLYAWLQSRKAGLTPHYLQELGLYLHLLGLEKERFPLLDSRTVKQLPLASSLFKSWQEIPDQVSVTIQVPRAKLAFLKSRTMGKIGIPVLSCSINGTGSRIGGWENHFSTVQICFGSAVLQTNSGGETSLEIEEDTLGWWGKEDMLLSVIVPTYILVQESAGVPDVHCNLVPTAHASFAYSSDLGDELHIFSTKLTGDKVFVTRYMPGLSGLPALNQFTKDETTNEKDSTSIKLSGDGSMVETLTRRLDISGDAKAKLADRSSAVEVDFEDPLSATIKVAGAKPLTLAFPAPVAVLKKKIRIARTSSYVEIEAPLLNPLQEGASFLLPASLHPAKIAKIPTLWNASRIDLDSFPALMTEDAKRLSWLTTLGSMAYTNRERRFHEATVHGHAPSGSKETHVGLRTEIKDGIFNILVQYAGVQGRKARIFALTLKSTGVQVLLIPSYLRLDLINHSAVLDVAVVPFTHAMMQQHRLLSILQVLGGPKLGIMQIMVSELELECWKGMLPAMVERCRTWKHDGPSCKYAKAGTVPLPGGVKGDGKELLCSCGVGKFPPGYLDDLKKDVKPSDIEYLLKNLATRAAIGLVFPVPYVEDCFLEGTLEDELRNRCANCASEKRRAGAGAEGTADGSGLLSCSRCRRAKYCSAECQRSDWKRHKLHCAKM